MSKSKSPEKGYGTHAHNAINIDPGEVRSILEAHNVTFNDTTVIDILNALRTYHSNKYLRDGLDSSNCRISPTWQDSRKEIEDAIRHLERLNTTIQSFDRRVARLLVEDMDFIDHSVSALSILFNHALHRFNEEGEPIDEENKTTANTGRPSLDAKKELIEELARIFKTAAGKKPGITWNEYSGNYEGKFLKLINNLIPLIGNNEYIKGIFLKRVLQGK